MSTLYLAYAVLGATVLLLALAADPIKERLWISEPLLAVGVGVLLGPRGLDILSTAQWGDPEQVLEELARLTLAISLMGVALRLPDFWVYRNWKPLAVILFIGMPLMWLLSSTCGLLILELPVLQAMLLGALVTPTDPVVASSIVTGRLAEQSVSDDTRHLISAESGANDGLAFLLVMLPVLLLDHSTPEALERWATVVLLGEVLGSVVGGIAVGFSVAWCLKRLYEREQTHERSLLAVTVAMALGLLGAAKLVHGDGILAVFASGLAFNWVIRDVQGHQEARHERIQETLKRFFDVPVFLFFGMIAPFDRWAELGWSAATFCVAVLVFRRIPVLLLLRRFLSPVSRTRDALFVGWFGPIAVAAMVYAAWAEVREGYEQLWSIGSLMIFVSIVVHGVTATPMTRLYARLGGPETPSAR